MQNYKVVNNNLKFIENRQQNWSEKYVNKSLVISYSETKRMQIMTSKWK